MASKTTCLKALVWAEGPGMMSDIAIRLDFWFLLAGYFGRCGQVSGIFVRESFVGQKGSLYRGMCFGLLLWGMYL